MGFIDFQARSILHIYSQGMSSGDQSTRRPRGFTAFGAFLFWGAAMATLAGTTLVYQGTMLDHIWSLNPRVYNQLAPLGVCPSIQL